MKELFDQLDPKERRYLWILAVCLAIVFFFNYFIARGEKNAYLSSKNSMEIKQKEMEKAQEDNRDRREEWMMWQEVQKDLKELGDNYLYKVPEVTKELRKDLQSILDRANVEYAQMKYDYSSHEGSKIYQVIITFNIQGTYLALKKLIHEVKQFPKFLVVEKISFSDIDSQTGALRLRISLAGYYGE